MLGQPFSLLGQAVWIECFEGLNDPGMEYTPPLLEETPIGDLVGQGMLEGVFVLRDRRVS